MKVIFLYNFSLKEKKILINDATVTVYVYPQDGKCSKWQPSGSMEIEILVKDVKSILGKEKADPRQK